MLNFGLLGRSTPIFNSGMFSNGGFERGLTDWQIYGTWTSVDETASNPGTTISEFIFQNFTFEDGATYEISADRVSGDAVVTFLVADGDSGVDITTGSHQFLGGGVAWSTGVNINTVGTIATVVDNLRLVKVS